MRLFHLGKLSKRKRRKSKPRRKLPPMFKCIVCQDRPGTETHYQLPLCKRCAVNLRKDIAHHGGAITELLRELQTYTGDAGTQTHPDTHPEDAGEQNQAAEALVHQMVDHAGQLVRYEDLRLQTVAPPPTEIIHLVRSGEIAGLQVKLRLGD